MKIQNIINGEVVTDPKILNDVLDLSINDNCMINTEFKFTQATLDRAEHAGYQLPMVMLSVKMARITKFNVTDFIQRLGYMDACGTSAINLPNGVDDLAALHGKLSTWISKGWEIETDLSHMERPDFVEYTEFKVVQSVLKDVRNLRESIKKQLSEKLPAEAAKELQ